MRNWKGAWKLDDKIFLFIYQKKIVFFIKKKSTTVWQLEGSKKKKSVWRGGGSSMATGGKYMKFLLHKLWCGLSQSAKMAVEEDGFPSLSRHKVRISCTSLIFWANLVFFLSVVIDTYHYQATIKLSEFLSKHILRKIFEAY